MNVLMTLFLFTGMIYPHFTYAKENILETGDSIIYFAPEGCGKLKICEGKVADAYVRSRDNKQFYRALAEGAYEYHQNVVPVKILEKVSGEKFSFQVGDVVSSNGGPENSVKIEALFKNNTDENDSKTIYAKVIDSADGETKKFILLTISIDSTPRWKKELPLEVNDWVLAYKNTFWGGQQLSWGTVRGIRDGGADYLIEIDHSKGTAETYNRKNLFKHMGSEHRYAEYKGRPVTILVVLDKGFVTYRYRDPGRYEDPYGVFLTKKLNLMSIGTRVLNKFDE